jgi:hypothetical protein
MTARMLPMDAPDVNELSAAESNMNFIRDNGRAVRLFVPFNYLTRERRRK